MRRWRSWILGVVTNLIQLVTTWFVFETAPDLGSAYLMKMGALRSALPGFTRDIAIPILRLGPDSPHDRPITQWWVWILWAVVFAIPLATAAATIGASTVESAARRASGGTGLWLTVMFALMSLVGAACAIPFACM